ncbi:MAG: gliding motility protein GldM [Bacteroidales bacterium]
MMAGKKTRQKMINMMYLVLTAMLALNVSTDVLVGFDFMQESIDRTIKSSKNRNQAALTDIQKYAEANPLKAQPTLGRAEIFKIQTDSLIDYIQLLKEKIVAQKGGSLTDIRQKDDIDAASQVMLGAGFGEGSHLRRQIDLYRENALRFITDSLKRDAVIQNLTTKVTGELNVAGLAWENALFNNMPTIAAVTLLSKIQNDVLDTETEVLNALYRNIDHRDFRVNELNAYVLPSSDHVIRGGRYAAKVILAAEDSTQRPTIEINGMCLQSDVYEIPATQVGEHTLTGHIDLENGNGHTSRFPFSQKYTVIEPSATVSATMMNIFYAGFENPVSISVPGITNHKISASMSNGIISRKDNGEWIAKPAKVGSDAVITVSAEVNGKVQTVSTNTFRVRALPLPAPYLTIDAGERYLGGKIKRETLLLTKEVEAGIFDDLLNISFAVLGFDIRLSNGGMTQYETSETNRFSKKQLELIRKMGRGSSFNISNIRVKGPDGMIRQLPNPIEVLL